MFKLSIPYWVLINRHPIGIMQSKEVTIELPAGEFELGVQIVFRLFKWQCSIGGSKQLCLEEGKHLHLLITDKERWWNTLFNIDLAFWLIRFFVEFPHPWNMVYEFISNGFFVLWMARIWFIRDRYFQLVESENTR